MEDAIDLFEIQAGVLEHADEHEPPDFGPVTALAGHPSVGSHQPSAFVVADRGGRQADLGPDFADGHQTVCHPNT